MKNVLPGPVNSQVIKDLVGNYYQNSIIFDYTINQWNTQKFMGHFIPDQHTDTLVAMDMKSSLENNERIQGRELVASIATIVDACHNFRVRGTLENPKPYTRGTCIMGNIITYDPQTNTVYGPGSKWLCIWCMPYCIDAATYAGLRFAQTIKNRLDYQNALLNMHMY